MIRNEISLTITRRYEIQKIYEGRVLSSRKNAKMRKERLRGLYFHASARCLASVFAAEKNTSLRFTVRNKGATGARSTPKRANARKKTYADDHFSFFLSPPLFLSLSIFFFERRV